MVNGRSFQTGILAILAVMQLAGCGGGGGGGGGSGPVVRRLGAEYHAQPGLLGGPILPIGDQIFYHGRFSQG